MLQSISQNQQQLQDFQQFPSFHGQSSLHQQETSNLDESFFSHFLSNASLPQKTHFIKILQLTINSAQSRLRASSFYKLRENLLTKREVKSGPPTSTSLEDDYSIQSPNYPNNPQVGFLGLESKFSLMEKVPYHSSSSKELNKQLFITKLQNEQLKKQVKNLKEEVEEAYRRKQKEVCKKQESLVGLMEELMEKNEYIEELKSTISLIEGKIKTKQKGIMIEMLDEDKQYLKRTLTRLEMVNDRLNHNLVQAKAQIVALENQNKAIEYRCRDLQEQIKKLKEINFDLENNRETVDIMRKQASTFSKRFTGKIQSVKRLEKKLSLVVKSIGFEDSIDLKLDSQSEVKTAPESTISAIKRSSSIKEQNAENKLEGIFNFLFHIAEENHQLMHQDLFDAEEKELLSTHKHLFNKSRGVHAIEKGNVIDGSGLFGVSLDEALNQKFQFDEQQYRKKLDKLQKQSQSLISSICILKQKQLYYRDMTFKLLKALNLKSMKRELQSIVCMICDMYEYSEVEKASIFPPKTHKLFGII